MEVVGEVPAELKRFVKLVVGAFYQVDAALIIDMLVKYQCVQEEALANHLKFEKKQLRQVIATLRRDKLVESRQRMETGPDGKSQSQSYYFINYQLFVNVVKYKLDIMRRKMETEERETTTQSSFECKACERSFTDLEVDQLIDFATGELRCRHCGASLIDSSGERSSDTPQQRLIRFNEQIEPLFDMIRNIENIRLAPELLEPEPQELRVHGQSKKKVLGQQGGPAGGWSGDASRYATAVVTVGDETSVTMRETKEIPAWLQKSTIIVDQADSDTRHRKSSNPFPTYEPRTATAEEMMEILLSHETEPDPEGAKQSDDGEDDQFEEVPEMTTHVKVGGEPVAIQDITQDHVNKMSEEEKHHYMTISRQLYAALYE